MGNSRIDADIVDLFYLHQEEASALGLDLTSEVGNFLIRDDGRELIRLRELSAVSGFLSGWRQALKREAPRLEALIRSQIAPVAPQSQGMAKADGSNLFQDAAGK
jgi:hypothetical protein